MINAKEYQKKIEKKLKDIFKETEVEESMKFPNDIYTPRIDVAVGPFAYKDSLKEKYDNLFSKHQVLLNRIKGKSINKDLLDFDINKNPRCFIAMEIENSTEKDTKHLLGSITNASILGKVGILIVFSNKKGLKNITNYLKFAKEHDKIKEHLFQNVALIVKKDFDQIFNVV